MEQTEEIKDLGFGSVLRYTKKNYLKWSIFIIVLNIIGVLVVLQSKFFPILQLLIAIDFVFLAVVSMIMKKVSMKQFALANGYTYEDKGNLETLPALYLKIGHSRDMNHVISGVYRDCPMKLFEFNCTIGYGKQRRHIHFTTFEIEYKTKLRSIFLRSKKDKWAITNLFEGMGDDMKFGKVLKLEGDFNHYFTLYVPNEDYEIEALQIFTPEIMVKLMDTADGFSFEFIDNKLFIYNRNVINEKGSLNKLFAFAKTLIEDLAPRLERLK
ncbi:MAG: hypothetical protein M3Q34_02610 [bacterium]|nr:hypothetical protein [bacterium]